MNVRCGNTILYTPRVPKNYSIWENWYRIFLTRNEFEGFENFVNILDISKVFVKLIEIELCFDFM